jgi:hypothetical protein
VSWLRPVGKKAVKYGPQAALVWKHAGKPLTDAAQQALISRQALRTALRHADTVQGGAILRVVDEGTTRWVVFSVGKAISCYPPPDRALADVVEHADLTKTMTPDQFRARQAERSRRRKAAEAAGALTNELRRRRNRLGPD